MFKQTIELLENDLVISCNSS